MIEPSADDVKTAERLNVSLMFTEYPVTIARLCALIAELQQRLDVLEKKRSR